MSGCICKGNWRNIVERSHALIGRTFTDGRGKKYQFFGLVHADDDYYYGMWHKKNGLRLLSCVGDIEGYGFELDEPV